MKFKNSWEMYERVIGRMKPTTHKRRKAILLPSSGPKREDQVWLWKKQLGRDLKIIYKFSDLLPLGES